MTQDQKTLLLCLEQYLKTNPNIRFSQALFNLNINQFADPINPENKNYLLRDIYNDSDQELLERIWDSLPEEGSSNLKTN